MSADSKPAETLAVVDGQAVDKLPADLYIPPDALVVFLETFEGPLDLLLYLIRRRNLDLLELSVADITDQYMGYIDLMAELKLDLAGEYLVMAATLAEIKSRLLLPRQEDDEEEDDPRMALIERLQDYERIKAAARQIGDLPRMERDIFPLSPERPQRIRERAHPQVDLREVLAALVDVMRRSQAFQHHAVRQEPLSVRSRMANVLAALNQAKAFVPFTQLFKPEEGRAGVVVTFLAITELLREGLADLTQSGPFAPIHVCVAGEPATDDDSP